MGSLLCAVIELLYDLFILKAIVWCQFVMFDADSILLPRNRHPRGNQRRVKEEGTGRVRGRGDGPDAEQRGRAGYRTVRRRRMKWE